MNTFIVANITSGHIFGTYEAADKQGALDAMAVDAGYKSYEAMQADVAAEEGEIAVEQIDW